MGKKASGADFQEFCEIVEVEWDLEWQRWPEFAKIDLETNKQLWFRENCVKLIEN